MQHNSDIRIDRSTSHSKLRRGRFLIIGLLIVVAAVLVWEEVLKYRFIPKRWGVVVPGKIYRSGQVSKWLIEDMLTKHGIRVVIDLNGIEPNDVHQKTEIEVINRLGLEHFRFALRGNGTGDICNYAKAIQVLVECEREGKPVLVHCAAGAQRTGGVVAAYRVLVKKEPPKKAYAELMRYGWKPHKDTILLAYLNSHMAELAAMLVEKRVLDRVPDRLPVIGP